MQDKRHLTSCFGLGRLPLAPGTWGSIPPAIIFVLLIGLKAPVISVIIIMAVLFLLGSIVCIKYVPEVAEALGKSDPGEVVADELAGQAVVFMLICFFQQESLGWAKGLMISVLGFLLFRLFDVFKPWPIRNMEKLGKGWGVLADDLLAGVYAALVLQISIWLWISQV